jgi:hypothetical protein
MLNFSEKILLDYGNIAGTANSGAPEFTPLFSGVRVTRSLAVCVCFVDRCLSLFFWSLWILITPLVSSNSSCCSFYCYRERTKCPMIFYWITD